MRRRAPSATTGLALVLALLAPGAYGFDADPDTASEPIPTDLEERVEVQLVLLDVVVVNRRGSTVADLTPDDFELRVDGRRVPVATLDAFCPDGATEDPRGRRARGTAAAEDDAQGALRVPVPAPPGVERPRKVVLVFDYFHMESAAETIDAALRTLRDPPPAPVEHMVVSLAETLRVVSPFTRARARTREAIERMREDVSLYAGNYGRLTERRFFERVRVLMDLLERIDGRKAVVLFSGPFLPDGFHHDPAFRDLSSLSARARASFYTIDTGGLRTPLDPHHGPLGGPAMLRRLALETGGRPTADTNDLGLAYERASRDLGCTYTLGFYDRRPRLDRDRRVSVSLPRRGLRAVHSGSYVIRSPERKHRSLVRTASMAPEAFRSEALRATISTVRPRSARRWETTVGVEIDPAHPALGGFAEGWELRGVLRKPGGTSIRRFRRDVTPAPETGDALEVYETLRIPPGRYTLDLVLAHAEVETPQTTSLEVDLPEIPRSR